MKAYDLTGKIFGNWKVLNRDYTKNNGRSNWLCECTCNAKTQRIVDGYSLISGRSTSCGCLKSYSKGEMKIAELLSQNNIPFEREKTFETCKFPETNYPARFDFWVNNTYLIEYDGEQHTSIGYGYMDTPERIQETKEHDQYKINWCYKNNIPLIRISYKQYKTLTIDDLLLID